MIIVISCLCYNAFQTCQSVGDLTENELDTPHQPMVTYQTHISHRYYISFIFVEV